MLVILAFLQPWVTGHIFFQVLDGIVDTGYFAGDSKSEHYIAYRGIMHAALYMMNEIRRIR